MVLRIATAARHRADAEHDARAWHAWHVAALQRAKRLPDLTSMLVRRRRRRAKVQTPAEMMAVARMITAAFGGRVA